MWAEVSAAAPAGGGVTLVNRVGVRMYLSIGPGGAGHASFVIGSPTPRRSGSGEPLVVANVRNTGKRTLSIGGTLMLSGGPGGLQARTVPRQAGRTHRARQVRVGDGCARLTSRSAHGEPNFS